MHKITVQIIVVIGLAMIFMIALQKILWAIYFAQLEILVFMSFMYYDLKNNNCCKK